MKKVLIHGDYDVDGILSSFLVQKYFEKQSDWEINVIIPKREWGYGISPKTKGLIVQHNPDLLICCDCGINTDFSFLPNNQEILIFDHHQKDDKTEQRGKIIHDTTRCTTDIVHKHLGFKSYKDCVAIATLADQIPLKDPRLIRIGISLFKNSYFHAILRKRL